MCDWGGANTVLGNTSEVFPRRDRQALWRKLGGKGKGRGIMKEKGIRVPTFPLTSLVISDWQVTDDN